MAFFVDIAGATQQVPAEALGPQIYEDAQRNNRTVAHHVNLMFKNADIKVGSAFQQLCASAGLTLHGKDNPFGVRPATIADILDGKSGFDASVNTQDRASPYGSASRTLFPAAIIEMMEDVMQPDRKTDETVFADLVAITVPIAGDHFDQPILSYANAGGANAGTNGAKAQRIAQLAQAPTILTLTTSERSRKIPTYGIGLEMSVQAMRATTIDLLALTVNRFTEIERDARVYTYLSNIFAGDLDNNVAAVSAVTSNSLDSTATGGALTHKACLKFLVRNRKKRKITHLCGDINAYLAWEGRSGRPGTANYDPTLARIDPQAVMVNQGFGNDVKWFLTDLATDGGPVPANTVWAIDASKGIMMVTNTEADFRATEQFILRRSEAIAWHWAAEAYRLFGDSELTAFDVLTIS